MLQRRGLRRVEVYSARVDQKAEGRLSHPAGVKRAEESILDPDQRRVGVGGGAQAALGGGAGAPYGHSVTRFRQSKAQIMAHQRKDSVQAAIAQKAEVLVKKPPRNDHGGFF